MSGKFFAAIFFLLFLGFAYAVQFEELPKAIQISGVANNSQVFCTAQILEHATLSYYDENIIEKPYRASILDSENRAIAGYAFSASPKDFGEEDFSQIGWIPFSITVPFEESASAVSIVDAQKKEKCRVNKSPNAPEIEIIFPQKPADWDSLQKIEWKKSDADKDLVLVDVFAAENNGLGWVLLAKESEENSILLAEPLRATRVMVVASDGFNSSQDISESAAAEGKVNAGLDFYRREILRPVQRMVSMRSRG